MDNKLYKLMNWPEIESIVYSDCDHPEKILGLHEVSGGILIQAFFPGALSVKVISLNNDKEYLMEEVDEEGFFALFIPGKMFSYEYSVEKKPGEYLRYKEVYNYIPMFWTNLLDKFKEGVFYDSYKHFGAHIVERKGVLGTEFVVYAPNAARVSVVGDFNEWDGRLNQMIKICEEGIFAIFIPGLSVGALYKYEIKLNNGITFLKRDPYAYSVEKGINDASRVIKDPEWELIKYKRKPVPERYSLLNVSLADFMNHGDGFAKTLSQYAKALGFSGILFEDFSFIEGKAVTNKGKVSLFSVNPEILRLNDLIELIDILHKDGLSVVSKFDFSGILPDDGGLRGFDGTNIYELDNNELDGLLSFNFANPYVRNYLISVCDYFTKVLSLDGICIDGLDRIMYLDFKKGENEYIPNMYGGNENLDGIEFLKHLNSILHKRYSNFYTLAAGSLVSNNLTTSLEDGGLGFDAKLHLMFDKDLMGFVSLDEQNKKLHYNDLTYSPVYIYCEKFVLVFGLNDYGNSFDAFENSLNVKDGLCYPAAKLLISYMFMHPGRKCLPFSFVEKTEIVTMIRTLNEFYLEKEISLYDDNSASFKWVNAIDSDNSVIAFIRNFGTIEYLCVCNFSGKELDYKLFVENSNYVEIFSTDQVKYKGSHRMSSKPKKLKTIGKEKIKYEMGLKLAPMSLYVFEKSPCQI